MKQKNITVLQIEPGKEPKTIALENRLEALQEAVSIGAEYTGLIELLGLEDGVAMLCNEEGKLIGLEPNRCLGDDIICGVFYIVGEDNHGNLISLPEKKLQEYAERFAQPEYFSTYPSPMATFISDLGAFFKR